MLLQAEFLAIALVLVYVGAVMVLFLFVVMMLDINLVRLREGFWSYLPLGGDRGAAAGGRDGAGAGRPAISASAACRAPRRCRPDYSNTKELGRLIYTDYVYPFELAAVILLVAIVAAIALTLRRRKDDQVLRIRRSRSRCRREDRVRIVSMPSRRAG